MCIYADRSGKWIFKMYLATARLHNRCILKSNIVLIGSHADFLDFTAKQPTKSLAECPEFNFLLVSIAGKCDDVSFSAQMSFLKFHLKYIFSENVEVSLYSQCLSAHNIQVKCWS